MLAGESNEQKQDNFKKEVFKNRKDLQKYQLKKRAGRADAKEERGKEERSGKGKVKWSGVYGGKIERRGRGGRDIPERKEGHRCKETRAQL